MSDDQEERLRQAAEGLRRALKPFTFGDSYARDCPLRVCVQGRHINEARQAIAWYDAVSAESQRKEPTS